MSKSDGSGPGPSFQPHGKEEVFMYLPPGVMKVLNEQADLSGDAISQICEDMIKEALRVWD